MSGNPEINVVKSPNDTVQSSAQNNISSNHLSTSFIPANLQPSCDIDRSTLSISESDYVAEGGYGRVYKAKWNGKLVAAKFISRRGPEQLKDFARELRALRKSKDCLEHIIEFFGLSKEPVTGDYILVMQYADSGTLKNYLENHTEPNTRELLDQRIDLCKDILKGLVFLHGERIIHRDLHSNNVLIHLGKALLADFGLSKSVLSQESTIVRGMHPYVDPEVLNYFKYPPKESSDIYSFGVLMWEIYTCIPSFSGRRDRDLVNDICNGVREKRKVGMPTDYVNLYEKCWNKKPLSRPTAKDALEDLETLKLKPTITEDDLQSIYELSDSEIEKKIMDKKQDVCSDNESKLLLNLEIDAIIEGKNDKDINLIKEIDYLKEENRAQGDKIKAQDDKIKELETKLQEIYKLIKIPIDNDRGRVEL